MRKFVVVRGEKLYKPSWESLKVMTIVDRYPWYAKSPRLRFVVEWLIFLSAVYPRFFSNDGRFKPGDRVVYNWKAYVQIHTAIERKSKKNGTNIQVVRDVLYSDKSGLDFESGDSCAAFWVRRAYFFDR